MVRTTRFLGLLSLIAVALGAPVAAEDDGPEWAHPRVTDIALELPVVGHAEPDVRLAPGLRYVLVLAADGGLRHASTDEIRPEDEAPTLHEGRLTLDDPRLNIETLDALGSRLRLAAQGGALREPSGASRVRLLLRADQDTPWVFALWLLQAAAHPSVGLYHVEFSVRTPEAREGEHLRLPHRLPFDARHHRPRQRALVSLEAEEADEGAAPTRLVRVTELDPSGRTDVASGELAAFPPGTAAVDRLRAALEPLRRGPGTAPVELEVTVALDSSGTGHFTFGDVLPLLAELERLGATIGLRGTPQGQPPRRIDAARHARRGVLRFEPPRGRPPPGGAARGAAVESALRWLAAHQAEDGGWDAAGFDAWCDGARAAVDLEGKGKAEHDTGVTALALLAFLGAGYTPRGEHPFAKTVSKGLRRLKADQDAEGCFGPREGTRWIYGHAVATCAMVEAYALTESPIFLGSAHNGLDFCALTRNPYFAWRYGVKAGDNDTSVTGWMVTALGVARLVNERYVKLGRSAPFTVDEEAFDGAYAWLEKMTDPDYGRVGYIQRGGSPARPQELIDKFPADKSEAMTALGTWSRILIGVRPNPRNVIARSTKLLRALPPTWNDRDGSIDMYYWFWGALALHQIGGRVWEKWEKDLTSAIVRNQREDTTHCVYKGSWDPVGPWGREGGRVYSTALLALCLETQDRYDRIHRR